MAPGGGQRLRIGVPVPRLRIAAGEGNAVTLDAALRATDQFMHASGLLNLSGFALLLDGADWRLGAGTYSATGRIDVEREVDLVMASNPTLPALRVLAGGALVMESTSAQARRVLTLEGELSLSNAFLDLGQQDLRLIGNGVVLRYQSSVVEATTGAFLFDGTTQTIVAGAGLVIPNLVLRSTVRYEGNTSFEVTRRLTFETGAAGLQFAAANANVVLGSGVTVVRDGSGGFSKAPVFPPSGNLKVIYRRGVTTGAELPSVSGRIARLTVAAPGERVVLSQSIVVSDTLVLEQGDLATTPEYGVQVAPGATVIRRGGTVNATRDGPDLQGGPYNLVYDTQGQAITTSSAEYPNRDVVSQLSVIGRNPLTLHADRRADSLVVRLEPAGTVFNLNAKALQIVRGAFLASGTLTTRAGGAFLQTGGDLVVGEAAAVRNDSTASYATEMEVVVAGTADVRGRVEVDVLSVGRSLLLSEGRGLEGTRQLRFRGNRPVFVVRSADNRPETIDLRLERLTLALAAPSGAPPPELLLVHDGPNPFTVGTEQLDLESGLLVTGPNAVHLLSNTPGFARPAKT